MGVSGSLPFHTPEMLGFYFPPALVWGAIALLPFWGVRWLLGRVGFYRFVWHRALFDTALYAITFGAVIFCLPIFERGPGWP